MVQDPPTGRRLYQSVIVVLLPGDGSRGRRGHRIAPADPMEPRHRCSLGSRLGLRARRKYGDVLLSRPERTMCLEERGGKKRITRWKGPLRAHPSSSRRARMRLKPDRSIKRTPGEGAPDVRDRYGPPLEAYVVLDETCSRVSRERGRKSGGCRMEARRYSTRGTPPVFHKPEFLMIRLSQSRGQATPMVPAGREYAIRRSGCICSNSCCGDVLHRRIKIATLGLSRR